jgi:hypothetical protein
MFHVIFYDLYMTMCLTFGLSTNSDQWVGFIQGFLQNLSSSRHGCTAIDLVGELPLITISHQQLAPGLY